MPRTVTLTFDDGSQHVYNGVPDDATPEAVTSRAQAEFPAKKIKALDGGRGAAPPKPIGAPEELSFMERNVAPVLEKVGNAINAGKPFMPAGISTLVDQAHRNSPVVQGLADPGTGIGQLLANLLPDSTGIPQRTNAAVAGREKEYQSARGADANTLDPARIATNVFNPLSFKAASSIPAAASTLGRVGQGAAVGGAFGASTPVTDGDSFWTDKGVQTGAGAALGGIVPPVLDLAKKGVTAGYHIIEPNLPGGIQRVAGRTANVAAGPRREAVIQNLEAPKSFIPGGSPTAGEAAVPAGSTEFSGLQKIVRDLFPSEYRDIGIAQEGARSGALGQVAQTPQAVDAAVAARKAAVDPLYAAARSGGPVDVNAAISQVDDLLTRNPGNRELVAELSNIRAGLTGEGGAARTDPEQVMSVIDGIKAALAKEDNKFIGGTVSGVRDTIKGALPNYQAADAEFAKASEPINQMRIGQMLKDKLVAPLNETERPAMFAGAMRDAPGTIKRSTGQPRYTSLDQVLDPNQMGLVEGVLADLSRKADFEKMAQTGLPAARKVVQGIDPIQLPNALHRPIMIINAVLKRIQGRAEGKSLEELSRLMQNPQELAKVMRAATPSEQQELVQVLGGALKNPALIGGPATASAHGDF